MPTERELLERLNPRQAEAVTHTGSPLLIVAGAGSGKTRVITHRIAWLAHAVGIPLWQILAVTFTNKAAREMRHRVCGLLGRQDDPSLAISTFHSRCAAILRRESEAAGIDSSFAILDDRDQIAAVKKAMEEAGLSDKRIRPAQVQSFINLAKMKLLTPEDCEEELGNPEIACYLETYKKYRDILDKNAALDFEDLIFRTVRLLDSNEEVRRRWQDRYRYVLVDEFQDTNTSQFELVKTLVGDRPDVCVVGDEDQAIYSWRGADVTNLLDFHKTFPDAMIVRLEQNYRSVGNVLKSASAVIRNNSMRVGKELWTDKEDGDPVNAICGVDDKDEAEKVGRAVQSLMIGNGTDADEIAVFYRSHRLARPFEDAFSRLRIPFRIVGAVRFYDRAEIKDLLAYLRLAVQPTNDLAFERVVNKPTRGVGAKSLADIAAHAALRRTSMYQAAIDLLDKGSLKGRAVKGLAEFIRFVGDWFDLAKTEPATTVLDRILADTNYKEDGVGDAKSIDGMVRRDNIEEFETVVAEYAGSSPTGATVAEFLEAMALDAQRQDGNDGQPKVSLMTIHNAKGLEFDYVFIVSMEAGLFPNSRTTDDPAQFEEERRLFYVALTRARKRVTLSRAMRRMREGFYADSEPSSFLYELPEETLGEDARRELAMAGLGFGARGGAGRRATGGGAPPYRQVRRGLAPPPAGNASRGGKLEVGDRVEHTILGPGIVTQKGGRPGGERVYVEFDDGREQEFVLRYAPLKRTG